MQDEKFELAGYTDADWGGCKDSYRSTSGVYLDPLRKSSNLAKQEAIQCSTVKL